MAQNNKLFMGEVCVYGLMQDTPCGSHSSQNIDVSHFFPSKIILSLELWMSYLKSEKCCFWFYPDHTACWDCLVIHWIVRVYKNCKMRGSVRTEEMKISHQILFSHHWPTGPAVTVIGIFCLYVWSHISETIHHRPQVSYIFRILGPRATFLRKKSFLIWAPQK